MKNKKNKQAKEHNLHILYELVLILLNGVFLQ